MDPYNSAPTWTGKTGELVFYDNGAGTIRLYAWNSSGAAWKSASFA